MAGDEEQPSAGKDEGAKAADPPPAFKKRVAGGKNFRRRGKSGEYLVRVASSGDLVGQMYVSLFSHCLCTVAAQRSGVPLET